VRGQGGELRRGSETAIRVAVRRHHPVTLIVTVAALVVATCVLGVASRASAGAANRDLGHGVSADSIKVGIAIIDYDSIADYLDYNHGDQKAVAQALRRLHQPPRGGSGSV